MKYALVFSAINTGIAIDAFGRREYLVMVINLLAATFSLKIVINHYRQKKVQVK